MSQEQRFFGNDKVQTLSNGSLLVAAAISSLKAARTSRGQSSQLSLKTPGSHGLHNDRGPSSPSLGCICLGQSPALALRGKSCPWRTVCGPGGEVVPAGLPWLFTPSCFNLSWAIGSLLLPLGKVSLGRNDGFSGLPRVLDYIA